MQMDLGQYKALHMNFELTRIEIRISIQVMNCLEIGLNVRIGVLTYST